MKKILVIISFAFIFLLSMSVVSAGFWGWLNVDVTRAELAGWTKVDRAGGGTCYVKTETGRSLELEELKVDETGAFEKSISGNIGDLPTSNCVTTCGPVTCTEWGSHPTGWCCICKAYHQTCETTCGGGAEVSAK